MDGERVRLLDERLEQNSKAIEKHRLFVQNCFICLTVSASAALIWSLTSALANPYSSVLSLLLFLALLCGILVVKYYDDFRMRQLMRIADKASAELSEIALKYEGEARKSSTLGVYMNNEFRE